LAKLIAIDEVARRPDESRKRFLADRISEGQVLVAKDGEHVIGYIVQDCSFFERGFVHLLYVNQQHRRRGVGAALLAEAVAACGTSRVFTSTNRSNERMQALLHKLGWQRAGEVEGLDEGDPEVFFYIDAS